MKVPELNAKSVAQDVPNIETQVAHLFSASAMAILKMFGLDSNGYSESARTTCGTS